MLAWTTSSRKRTDQQKAMVVTEESFFCSAAPSEERAVMPTADWHPWNAQDRRHCGQIRLHPFRFGLPSVYRNHYGYIILQLTQSRKCDPFPGSSQTIRDRKAFKLPREKVRFILTSWYAISSKKFPIFIIPRNSWDGMIDGMQKFVSWLGYFDKSPCCQGLRDRKSVV